MSESNVIELGGLKFDLPSLPWRAVRELQPGLLGWVDRHDFAGDDAARRLSSADLDELAGLVFLALRYSPQGKALTREAFDDLPIPALALAQAVRPILRACGLTFAKPGEDAADPKA